MASDPFADAISSIDSLLFGSWFPILFVLGFALFYWCRSYMRGAQLISKRMMTGKTVLITGGNGGIGREIGLEMAWRGARVILACRDKKKGEEAVSYIRSKSGKKTVTSMQLDLCSFKSIDTFVRDFLKTEDRLDVLINNAGVILHPKSPKTEDGFEVHFQTNYLGHFKLTHLLLHLLKKSKPSRIINVAAVAFSLGKIDLNDVNFDNTPDYTESNAYSQSKLAVMMFTKGLDKKLVGSGVTVNSIHPGVVLTDGHKYLGYYSSSFVRYSLYPIIWFLTKSAADGAQTPLHLAIAEELEDVSGKYFIDCASHDTEPHDCLDDDGLVDELYQKSLRWCKL